MLTVSYLPIYAKICIVLDMVSVCVNGLPEFKKLGARSNDQNATETRKIDSSIRNIKNKG